MLTTIKGKLTLLLAVVILGFGILGYIFGYWIALLTPPPEAAEI